MTRETWTTEDAFRRYEEVRLRLPRAVFPATSTHLADLSAVADHVDAFVLDSFGVLNVGDTPIPAAVERMSELRSRGKRLIVLTNAASAPKPVALAKYERLGFDFAPDEVVSSRDVCASRLSHIRPGARWGAIAMRGDGFEDFAADVVAWSAEEQPEVDGFLLLSSDHLSGATITALEAALKDTPRDLVVANPDLVAPRETGLTREPGFYAHHLADLAGLEPVFYGKPFQDAYQDVVKLLDGIAPERIAMVGDTLHTDILGGRAAGMKTVLIEDHGLFAGRDVSAFIANSGIVPDFICPTT